jgi:hypothetical protein
VVYYERLSYVKKEEPMAIYPKLQFTIKTASYEEYQKLKIEEKISNHNLFLQSIIGFKSEKHGGCFFVDLEINGKSEDLSSLLSDSTITEHFVTNIE